MSKTMRQTSVRVLAHCLRLWKEWGQGSMNNTQSKTLLTEGSIWKKMVAFALPLFFGNLFQQLYSFVDSVVVGRGIGAQALAAVGATSIVVWLTLGFAMGITKGFCIHISQAYGKKDYHLVNRGFFVASVLSLIVGTMISIVGSLAIRVFLLASILVWYNFTNIFDENK